VAAAGLAMNAVPQTRTVAIAPADKVVTNWGMLGALS